jgi:carotenoid cleavage dioxygenase-like enzyme
MSLHVEVAVNPYLEGPYEAVDQERTVGLTLLEGTLPDDLNGVYVRNGPNPQHHPIGRYHWFDGDGMVHSIHFADGTATYRNRWVRTEGFVQERDSGQAIWQGILEPFGDEGEKDTANTDVIYHRDKLLALWYRAGAPYALDPVTLDDLGREDFQGTLRSEMSAHAKVDEVTGELLFFDYGITPPYMRYGVIGADGRLAHFTGIDIPGPRLPHDMAITEHFSVLMDLPLYAEPEAAKSGRHKLFFDREMPARFGVIPRYGSAADVRWFEAAPCYIYHVVNAWEEGDEIVMDVCRVKQPRAVRREDGPLAALLTYLRLDAHIHRYRFDLKTGRTREQVMDEDNTEFPSIRQDLAGRPTNAAYTMHISPEKTLLFDGLQKYDVAAGTAETYWFGDGRWGSEAPFAPRPGSSAEDDGYLVSYVYDEREGTSELHVLDAAAISAGPVCRLGLPFRVPLGFHATWIPAEKLPGGSA